MPDTLTPVTEQPIAQPEAAEQAQPSPEAVDIGKKIDAAKEELKKLQTTYDGARQDLDRAIESFKKNEVGAKSQEALNQDYVKLQTHQKNIQTQSDAIGRLENNLAVLKTGKPMTDVEKSQHLITDAQAAEEKAAAEKQAEMAQTESEARMNEDKRQQELTNMTQEYGVYTEFLKGWGDAIAAGTAPKEVTDWKTNYETFLNQRMDLFDAFLNEKKLMGAEVTPEDTKMITAIRGFKKAEPLQQAA